MFNKINIIKTYYTFQLGNDMIRKTNSVLYYIIDEAVEIIQDDDHIDLLLGLRIGLHTLVCPTISDLIYYNTGRQRRQYNRRRESRRDGENSTRRSG